MRLLVIEDDATLREALVRKLGESGFAVEQAADGKEGLYFALEYPVDLAIIDLGLPEVSGLDIIREVREKGKTYPILILTARDRWEDKVDGLSAGASVLTAGPVALDMSRQELTVNDDEIDLTSFEYKIIEYLMVRAGQVISKAELTDRLYDQDFERVHRSTSQENGSGQFPQAHRNATGSRLPLRAGAKSVRLI
jgi:two-component system response regulator PhoP